MTIQSLDSYGFLTRSRSYGRITERGNRKVKNYYWTPDWLWRWFRIQVSRHQLPCSIILGNTLGICWCEIIWSKGRQDVDAGMRRIGRIEGGRRRQYSFIDPAMSWMYGITISKWREPTKANDWWEWENVWGRGRLGFGWQSRLPKSHDPD